MAQSTRITLTIGLLVAVLVACDKTPTGPATTTNPPVQPGSVVLQTLAIDGPASVAPGIGAEFKATGRMSDGTLRDYTPSVTWRSSDNTILSISAGRALGGRVGGAVITVQSGAIRASLEVSVVPAGTVLVAGNVSESGLAVAGATVEIESLTAPSQTLSTKTDFQGHYDLAGVPGDIILRVNKDGYLSQTSRLSLAANLKLNVDLVQASRSDLSGAYQLTITAASQCPSTGQTPLRDELRTRQYSATITQDGPRLHVVVGGAAFELRSGAGNNFDGRVEPAKVTFTLKGVFDLYYYGTYPSIVELLPSGSYLTPDGIVSATSSSTGVAGTLDGGISELRVVNVFGNTVIGACYSSQHRFALTR